MIDVPIDMYASASEIRIVVPLGGVKKKSIKIVLDKDLLVITGERLLLDLKQTYIPLQEKCFWGIFEKRVQLPVSIYYEKISSSLSPENVLLIVIPKLLRPDSIPVVIR